MTDDVLAQMKDLEDKVRTLQRMKYIEARMKTGMVTMSEQAEYDHLFAKFMLYSAKTY